MSKHWTDKGNERVKGVPLTRVPEWGDYSGAQAKVDWRALWANRLEDALMRIDELESERESLAREAWKASFENTQVRHANDSFGGAITIIDMPMTFREWWSKREGGK